MKRAAVLSLACAGIALLAWWIHGQHGAPAPAQEPVASAAAGARIGPDRLRYPPGSAQLAYLAIEAVRAETPPAMEALPARLVFDEDHTVRVFTPMAGKVSQIVVQPGQKVKAGDALAWLTAPDYDTAVADLHKAQADSDAKRAAYERAVHLHDAGVIATRELEAARADARGAQAELERASARLRPLGQASRDGRFALRAPIGGFVAERHVNPGQELRPDAADPAFLITDPSHLDVVADVAEADAAALHVGQRFRIEADGVDLPMMEGAITHVGLTMDPLTHRVPVRAHLANPPPNARPEMFVRLTPLADEASQAVAVPNSAIVTTGRQSFVFVEQGQGVLVKTPVQLLRRGSQVSHISQGLAAGARVVTKGAVLLDAELASDG